MIPICDQNIVIIYSVAPEILVSPTPDAINLSEKAEAISCFVYEFFISEKLRDQSLLVKSQYSKINLF